MMIITQTPVRVSFFGGGTDYPLYFRKHGGATLATSINKYTIITIHQLNNLVDYAVRVHYSQVESVNKTSEIQHVSARECLNFMNIKEGVEIHYVSDLPARTGVGSSSSATVGLLHALHAFKGEMVSQEQIAQEAVHVEQDLIKERVGCQDQYACALGGMLHLEFLQNGQVRANPVAVTIERLKELQARLMLIYTGDTRNSHEVLEEQFERIESGTNTRMLDDMKALVPEAIGILTSNNDLKAFGQLLDEAWKIKRGYSSTVSTSSIDLAYETARKAGAVGGKLLGAGGGGFLLFYVEPEQRERVRNALKQLREAPFFFENSGTRMIFYRSY
jgi:D-glycero-alpha-D-manno-heptose-7-phosphate kinase